MLHRSVADDGFKFGTDRRYCEDMLAWINLSMRYTLLGINEPLSIMTWTEERATPDPAQLGRKPSGVIEAMERHLIHRMQTAQIEKLRASVRGMAKGWVPADRYIAALKSNDGWLSDANMEQPAFPATGNRCVSAWVRAA